jgi:hypothetical protein
MSYHADLTRPLWQRGELFDLKRAMNEESEESFSLGNSRSNWDAADFNTNTNTFLIVDEVIVFESMAGTNTMSLCRSGILLDTSAL